MTSEALAPHPAACGRPHALAPSRTTDEHRVEGRMAVRAIARELMLSNTDVGLFADGDLIDPLLTRVIQLEDDRIAFELSGPDSVVARTLAARVLTVVGLPGAVRIQFDVSAPSVTPGRTQDGEPADIVVCALPSRGWRIQRRNAFRVAPPRIDRARLILRLPDDGGEKPLLIDDLSIGGLSVRWPIGTAVPELGDGYRHCRLETEASPAIPCDLIVTRVQPGRERTLCRVSFEFYAMPTEVLRLVQMYVMDIERRTRASR